MVTSESYYVIEAKMTKYGQHLVTVHDDIIMIWSHDIDKMMQIHVSKGCIDQIWTWTNLADTDDTINMIVRETI